MNEEEKDNPMDEVRKHLEKMFGGGKGMAVVPPFFGAQAREEDAGAQGGEEPETAAILGRIREFNMKPREIREHLDRFVIRQDEAKKVLSVAVCDHFNHVRACLKDEDLAVEEYHKQNILLLGPTGVGKTYLMRTIAKLIGVPFVKADATKFSETGYVGADVEDLVRDLVKAANGNIELAQYGIIYIDEIDKIANAGGMSGRDVSGRGVQINLLKLMEEADVNQFSPNDIMAQMQAMMGGGKPRGVINTRHILFIVSGAFDKLTDIIKTRLNRQKIGFDASGYGDDVSGQPSLLQEAETRDFIEFGFEPEFVGRLPVRVACETLLPEDLALIMTTSEGSILRQYHRDFEGFGIRFSISSDAIQAIAGRAYEQKTGARGILTILERVFRDFKFELPSTGIREFEVDASTVADPRLCLDGLLEGSAHLLSEVHRDDIERFRSAFAHDNGFEVSFSEEAIKEIVRKASDADKSVRYICESLFKDARHGLSIISRNTGRVQFELGVDFVESSDAVISRLVVESFREAEGREQDTEKSDVGSETPKGS